MSIEKKLNKIQQTIVSEGRQQEAELQKKIKKFMVQISENGNFLTNLEIVKDNFK